MRKVTFPVLAMALGSLSFVPPVAADTGFHGFTAFDTHAQGQVATMIGYLGDLPEEDRIVGALSEINGPPSGARNFAAFFQKGAAASYTYGVIGGPGGAAGVLPQPGPGEANAFYPAEPNEMTFSGPVGAGAGQAVDSRFYAKATDVPTGRAEAAVSSLSVPGQLTVGKATVVSHSEPVKDGVMAESVASLHDITIGPLRIQDMVSRAYGFISALPGKPAGEATTVVQGATVNGTPVQITDHGVVVSGSATPGAQEQVNDALASAGLSDVRLTPSVVTPGRDTESVSALAGVLRVVHRDAKFGAEHLQGLEGGGFAVGGADVALLGRRPGRKASAATTPAGEGMAGRGVATSGDASAVMPPPVGGGAGRVALRRM